MHPCRDRAIAKLLLLPLEVAKSVCGQKVALDKKQQPELSGLRAVSPSTPLNSTAGKAFKCKLLQKKNKKRNLLFWHNPKVKLVDKRENKLGLSGRC